jgi:hypothetical protein
MAKEAAKLAQNGTAEKPRNRIGGSTNARPKSEDAEALSPLAAKVLAEMPSSFANEEEALSSLISSVLDSLGSDSDQRSEMQSFLQTLLDTDPELKKDLLEGVTVRS